MKKIILAILIPNLLMGCNEHNQVDFSPAPENNLNVVDEFIDTLGPEYSESVAAACGENSCQIDETGQAVVVLNNRARTAAEIKYYPQHHLLVSQSSLDSADIINKITVDPNNVNVNVTVEQVPTSAIQKINTLNAEQLYLPTNQYVFIKDVEHNNALLNVTTHSTPNGLLLNATDSAKQDIDATHLFIASNGNNSPILELGTEYTISQGLRNLMLQRLVKYYDKKIESNKPNNNKELLPPISYKNIRGASDIFISNDGTIYANVAEDNKRAWVFEHITSTQPLSKLNFDLDISGASDSSFLNLYLINPSESNGDPRYRANIHKSGDVTLYQHNGNGKYDIAAGNFDSLEQLQQQKGNFIFNQNYFDATFFAKLNIQWSSHGSDTQAIAGESFIISKLSVTELDAELTPEPVIDTARIKGSSLKVNPDGSVTATVNGTQDDAKNNAGMISLKADKDLTVSMLNFNFEVEHSNPNDSGSRHFINIYLMSPEGNKARADLFLNDMNVSVNSMTPLSIDEFKSQYGNYIVRSDYIDFSDGAFLNNFIYRSHDTSVDGSGEQFTVREYSYK